MERLLNLTWLHNLLVGVGKGNLALIDMIFEGVIINLVGEHHLNFLLKLSVFVDRLLRKRGGFG
jgi:hypothetical protein